MTCTNCGKETKPPFTKCYACFKSIKEAQPGDKCIVCSGLMMRKDGKFGEFMTCVAWSSHLKQAKNQRPTYLGQRGKNPKKPGKLKRLPKPKEQPFSWGTGRSKPKTRDFRYGGWQLPTVHETE